MKTSEFRKLIREEVKKVLNESTRSTVGIELPDGKIKSIYVHFDGQLRGVGKTLKDYYKDPNTVKKLINLGNASGLDKSIDKPKDHTYDNPIKGYSVFYGRDRGEKNVGAYTSRDEADFTKHAKNFGADYIYLFRDGDWLYKPRSGGFWRTF